MHTAYWKYAVWRSLTGAKRGTFGLKGSNWFGRPAPGKKADGPSWAADVRLLVAEHARLRAAIAVLSERSIERRLGGRAAAATFLIRGIAAHDLYHAGQIQLIKRLGEKRARAVPRFTASQD